MAQYTYRANFVWEKSATPLQQPEAVMRALPYTQVKSPARRHQFLSLLPYR